MTNCFMKFRVKKDLMLTFRVLRVSLNIQMDDRVWLVFQSFFFLKSASFEVDLKKIPLKIERFLHRFSFEGQFF